MQDDSVGPRNIPGYNRVEALADYLFQFRHKSGVITQSQADRIIQLWNALHSYNKIVGRKPHHQPKLTQGKFKQSKGMTVIAGVDSTRRYGQVIPIYSLISFTLL